MKFVRSWIATLLMLAVALTLALPVQAATIKALVNSSEITDTQVAARAKLMSLEKRGVPQGTRYKQALEELIDEALKQQEAKRIGVTVSEAQVKDAFANVARNLKVSPDKLTALLLGSGVNPETLKARLRASIAWRDVARKVIAPRVSVSDLELEKKAQDKITPYDNFDYMLKEVRFIIPKGSRVSSAKRTAQANQYRRSFSGCDTAVDLSLSYTDVAVIDVGRRHATQLPDAIAKELAKLNVGQLTKPRVGDGGVTMLAVCAKDNAEDTTFVKNELRQQEGNDKLQSAADAYLKELRAKAAITYK